MCCNVFSFNSYLLSGAVALAEFIAESPRLLRLDLRGNHIRTGGLMALTLSLKVNQSVTRLDLDQEPKKEAVSIGCCTILVLIPCLSGGSYKKGFYVRWKCTCKFFLHIFPRLKLTFPGYFLLCSRSEIDFVIKFHVLKSV
jgi:hypothetical protein